MKEETYNLNKENKSLVQKPEMKEPDEDDYYSTINSVTSFDDDGYNKDCDKYEKHIASLTTYPISGIVPPEWKTGRDLVEGKDFKIENRWYKANTPDEYAKDFAIPIDKQQSSNMKAGDIQTELWRRVRNISANNAWMDYIQIVKETFTITLK